MISQTSATNSSGFSQAKDTFENTQPWGGKKQTNANNLISHPVCKRFKGTFENEQ